MFYVTTIITLKFISTQTQKTINYAFETSLDKINEFINYNMTKLITLCDESDYEQCLSEIYTYYEIYNFANLTSFDNSYKKTIIKYNNILANFYFYVGEIGYYGLSTQKPNLVEGFRYLLISAYYGNPASLYKMYILFETNIISSIIYGEDYLAMLASDPLLTIIRNSAFYKNFEFPDDYARKNIAFNFLFSSALSKHNSAMTTIGFKYLKGNNEIYIYF